MPPPGPPSFSDDDERQRRLEALRGLAQSQSATAPAAQGATSKPTVTPPSPLAGRHTSTAATKPQRLTRPWWLIVGSVVLVIAVVVGVIVHQVTSPAPHHSAKTSPSPAVLALAPSLTGVDCLKDAAWSPSGSEIAVLGYQGQCPDDFPSNYNYEAGVLQIYSATTGHLLTTILPDAAEEALPGAPPPDNNAQSALVGGDTSHTVLDYQQVLWSPDGKQLALTFFITYWKGLTILPGYNGLVLVNADGSQARAALYKETGQPYAGLRWDTSSMEYDVLPDQSRYSNELSLPPGTSYTWSADGQLVPSGSLVTAAASPAPVGNPDGGSSFTIWQPSNVQLSTQAYMNNQTVTVSPGAYSWGTSFLAWSPDGRYLINPVSLAALLHPAGQPSPTAAGLQELGIVGEPSLAAPDPAFRQLLTLLPGLEALGRQAQVDMAWSPNGRILAAIPDVGGTSASSLFNPSANVPRVTLYDSATGTPLETLTAPANQQAPSNPSIGSSSFLQWSADGSHLLVFIDQLDTITIWGPSRLPSTA